MKKAVFMFSRYFASFALMSSILVANRSCVFLINQPELPEKVKSLRKF